MKALTLELRDIKHLPVRRDRRTVAAIAVVRLFPDHLVGYEIKCTQAARARDVEQATGRTRRNPSHFLRLLSRCRIPGANPPNEAIRVLGVEDEHAGTVGR